MIVFLQIAVILAVSAAMRRVVAPFRQPAVIGEMLAGISLGPSLLGWISPGLFAALFPPPSLPSLNALSQIGLVLFMFGVGLRIGTPYSGPTRRVALVTSIVSIAVPFVLGAWLATALHERLAPAGVSVLPFSLFIGAAMSITAFPVLARLLLDRNLLTTDLGRIAISCAAFDDVTGWLILAAVMMLMGHEGGPSPIVRVVLLVLYLAVMLVVVRPVVRMLARPQSEGDDLIVPLLVLLLSAVATEWVGIHALFGAFFAGTVMPRDSHVERRFVERVEPLTMTLLLPVFFAFTGLRTSIQLIDSAPLWADAAMILVVAVAGKAGASTLAARASGVPWREAAALGALLNTRGLIELVILTIGLERGVLSPTIFSMMVLMAIVTTCMTSPIVGALVPGDPRGAGARPAGVA